MAEGKIQSLKKQNEKIAEGKVTKIKDIAKEKIKKAEEKAEDNFFSSVSSEEDGN